MVDVRLSHRWAHELRDEIASRGGITVTFPTAPPEHARRLLDTLGARVVVDAARGPDGRLRSELVDPLAQRSAHELTRTHDCAAPGCTEEATQKIRVAWYCGAHARQEREKMSQAQRAAAERRRADDPWRQKPAKPKAKAPPAAPPPPAAGSAAGGGLVELAERFHAAARAYQAAKDDLDQVLAEIQAANLGAT